MLYAVQHRNDATLQSCRCRVAQLAIAIDHGIYEEWGRFTQHYTVVVESVVVLQR